MHGKERERHVDQTPRPIGQLRMAVVCHPGCVRGPRVVPRLPAQQAVPVHPVPVHVPRLQLAPVDAGHGADGPGVVHVGQAILQVGQFFFAVSGHGLVLVGC